MVFLFIHGLKGSPLQWKKYLDILKSDLEGMHYLSPHVPFQGNCSLKDAAEPLIKIVEDYLRCYPDQPVHLIGTSNRRRTSQTQFQCMAFS